MGLRVRLKASYDTSGFSPHARVIAEALKRYGMILADNGSPWYISGMSDPRFDDDVLHELDDITGRDLEVVDTTGWSTAPEPARSRPRSRSARRTGRPTAPDPASSRMADLRARIRAGETLIGVFSDLGSPLAAELCGGPASTGPSSTWSTAPRPRPTCSRCCYAVGTTPMAADRPAPVGRAAACRPGARPRCGRDHAAAAPVDRGGARRRSRYLALSAGRPARRRAADAGRRSGGARPRRRGRRGQRADRRHRPDRVGRAPWPTPTRSRHSTRSTCCSSARPT